MSADAGEFDRVRPLGSTDIRTRYRLGDVQTIFSAVFCAPATVGNAVEIVMAAKPSAYNRGATVGRFSMGGMIAVARRPNQGIARGGHGCVNVARDNGDGKRFLAFREERMQCDTGEGAFPAGVLGAVRSGIRLPCLGGLRQPRSVYLHRT